MWGLRLFPQTVKVRNKDEKQARKAMLTALLSLSHSLYMMQYSNESWCSVANSTDERAHSPTLLKAKQHNFYIFILCSKKYRTLSFRYHIFMSLIIQTLTVFHSIHFQITTFSDTTKSHHTATIITNSLSSICDILEEREKRRRLWGLIVQCRLRWGQEAKATASHCVFCVALISSWRAWDSILW